MTKDNIMKLTDGLFHRIFDEVATEAGETDFPAVLALLGAIHEADYEVIKTEHLYEIDGARAYSLGQGQ